MDAQMKVSRAITKLVISHPFFGSMALSLDVHQDDNIGTMCTDGKSIKWSAEFVNEISQDETTGTMAHEACHVTFKHMLRRGERDPELWNIATDFAINDILLEAGFTLPKGGLYDPQYKGLSAETIYDRLPDDAKEQFSDAASIGMIADASDDNGNPMSPAEKSQMEADINAKVMMAASAAKSVGKLPAQVEELVNVMRRTEVDLDTVVARFVGGDQPDNYTYRKPNKRGFEMYDMYNPSVDAITVGDTIIAIDESGSVSTRELQYFLGVINSVIEDKQPRSITVICHDGKVQNVTRYEQGEEITEIECHGRGGTCVTPVFKYIEENQLPCDQVVWLTDLQIWDFPESTPDFPVLWVSTWDQAQPAPFGETTYIKAA